MGEDIFGFGFSSSPSVPPVPPSPDKNYVHHQIVASDIWIVPHNLGKKCAVDVTNDAGIGIGSVIEWNNDNEVTIYFNSPRTGYVYCN